MSACFYTSLKYEYHRFKVTCILLSRNALDCFLDIERVKIILFENRYQIILIQFQCCSILYLRQAIFIIFRPHYFVVIF